MSNHTPEPDLKGSKVVPVKSGDEPPYRYGSLFSNSSSALVIGAGTDECAMGQRWGNYFHPIACRGLPDEYLDTKIAFQPNIKEFRAYIQNPRQLLSELLSAYDQSYSKYMEKHFSHSQFESIIFDRAMQGLCIDNPFGLPNEAELSDKRVWYNLLSTERQKRYLNGDGSLFGTFTEHVFCLLCLHLLRALNEGGRFIVDTQFLTQKHIELLAELFHSNQKWDYYAEKNRVLKYHECYEHNNHGHPRFMEFLKYKAQPLDYRIYQQRLIDLDFQPNDCGLNTSDHPVLLCRMA